MRIVGRSKLDEFCTKHPLTRGWVRAWLSECGGGAVWKTSTDIKLRFPSASFLSGNRVIFNVKGNDYRLVVQVAYNTGVVVVNWVGTHEAYSSIKWEVVAQ